MAGYERIGRNLRQLRSVCRRNDAKWSMWRRALTAHASKHPAVLRKCWDGSRDTWTHQWRKCATRIHRQAARNQHEKEALKMPHAVRRTSADCIPASRADPFLFRHDCTQYTTNLQLAEITYVGTNLNLLLRSRLWELCHKIGGHSTGYLGEPKASWLTADSFSLPHFATKTMS